MTFCQHTYSGVVFALSQHTHQWHLASGCVRAQCVLAYTLLAPLSTLLYIALLTLEAVSATTHFVIFARL